MYQTVFCLLLCLDLKLTFRDIVSLHPVSSNIPSIDDVIFMSNSIENFNENLLINFTK